MQQQQQQQQQQKKIEKRKIKIKPKEFTKLIETTKLEEKNQEHQEKRSSDSCEKQSIPHPHKKRILIIKKKQECRSYNDIVPPASIIYNPKNDLYRTPPKQCCRFFIESKHCFLRERDNACISPISRTIIGFWNEKVGKECKLLPIQDETTYEQEIINVDEQRLSEIVSSLPSPLTSTFQKSKPRFISDAQRSRIASEPVALLREKIAKQYGMTIKKN